MARLEAMPLYATIERIHNEVNELGAAETLSPQALHSFDQFHYDGTEAVARAARSIGLKPADRVLEIGSGIGGPARYLAHTIGCRVTAVERQPALHDIAAALTARCGLGALIDHVEGDALTTPLADAAFDAAVSWLAIHHIPERPRLLRRIAAALRTGGRLYIEDLYERAPFSAIDQADVLDTLYGVTMTGLEEYRTDLAAAGFTDVRMTDMTEPWTRFCATRTEQWRATAARQLRVHGADTVAALDRFFATMQRLFESGSLGGVIIAATKSG